MSLSRDQYKACDVGIRQSDVTSWTAPGWACVIKLLTSVLRLATDSLRGVPSLLVAPPTLRLCGPRGSKRLSPLCLWTFPMQPPLTHAGEPPHPSYTLKASPWLCSCFAREPFSLGNPLVVYFLFIDSCVSFVPILR